MKTRRTQYNELHSKEVQKVVKEITTNQQAAKEFLIKSGILNKSGKLHKNYR